MTKIEFLHNLKATRKRWEESWKGIDLTDISEPPSPGKMTLRDILYHVAWYEREMVEVLQLRTLVGSPWWDLSTDERNAHILMEGQSISLTKAYRQEQQIYAELVRELQKLRDEELEQASFFKDMPPEWKPWEVIASNTYEHYPQHIQDIKNT